MRLLVTSVAAVVVLAGTACARGSTAGEGAGAAASGGASDAAPARALAAVSAVPVVVLPAQRLHAEDAMGWLAAAGPRAALLAALDDELAFAVRERGTASAWVWPPDVARTLRRSPTIDTDVYALPVDALLGGRATPPELPEALVRPLRGIAALGGQRFVVVPAELRFVRRDDGQGEAVLRVALVDTRGARRLWSGDVRSAPASTFDRGLLVSLAEHFADLIAAPQGADGA